MGKVDLKLDWATFRATRYACENWHYSGTVPASRLVKIGVWEEGRFVGVIVFGIGCGHITVGSKYGLARTHQMAELTRVALRDHISPVTRMIAVALRMLKRQSPGIRLVISFADERAQGHLGKIYQAGNWVYAGVFEGKGSYKVRGKIMHARSVYSRGWVQQVRWLRDHVDPDTVEVATRKHRYLMPLDAEMRLRIAPMALPYPSRDKQAMAGPPEQRRGSADHHAPQPHVAA